MSKRNNRLVIYSHLCETTQLNSVNKCTWVDEYLSFFFVLLIYKILVSKRSCTQNTLLFTSHWEVRGRSDGRVRHSMNFLVWRQGKPWVKMGFLPQFHKKKQVILGFRLLEPGEEPQLLEPQSMWAIMTTNFECSFLCNSKTKKRSRRVEWSQGLWKGQRADTNLKCSHSLSSSLVLATQHQLSLN